MKRKILSLFLILAVLASLAVPAAADMLWEPFGNDYYSKHYEDLDYMNRTYVVPEGITANVYQSPELGGLITTLEAGTRIYIGPYGEINGETWACGYPYGDFDNEGWVRLDRLQKEYAHADFESDFGSQFVATDDVLSREDIDGDIQTWTYPGSGILDRTIPADVLGGGYNNGVMDFRYVWTDPDGGRWGYVGYYMGSCGWVWLDDPTNPEPPLRLYPEQSSTVTDTSPEQNPGGSQLILLGLLAAVLVIGTAAAVLVVKKRRGAN